MPHTWAGSDFIRSVRSLFVFEREPDQALILAAGVPRAWVAAGKQVALKRLPTAFGTLGYTLESDGPDRLRMRISGDLRMPPGNLVVRPPLERPLVAVRVNGRPVERFSPEEVMVSEIPAVIELDSAPETSPTAALLPTPTR
jgi:hypothetical protein